jgi:hypothetical protein
MTSLKAISTLQNVRTWDPAALPAVAPVVAAGKDRPAENPEASAAPAKLETLVHGATAVAAQLAAAALAKAPGEDEAVHAAPPAAPAAKSPQPEDHGRAAPKAAEPDAGRRAPEARHESADRVHHGRDQIDQVREAVLDLLRRLADVHAGKPPKEPREPRDPPPKGPKDPPPTPPPPPSPPPAPEPPAAAARAPEQRLEAVLASLHEEAVPTHPSVPFSQRKKSPAGKPTLDSPDYWTRPAPTVARAHEQVAQGQAAVAILAGVRTYRQMASSQVASALLATVQLNSFPRTLGFF